MKKRFIFVVVIAMISTMLVSCRDYDDFEFSPITYGGVKGYNASFVGKGGLVYVPETFNNEPILGFKFGFNSGLRAEVLFINTLEQLVKWGTKNAINLPAPGLPITITFFI